MRHRNISSVALCALLTTSCGQLLPIDDPICRGGVPRESAFSQTRNTYEFAGVCDLTQTRLQIPVKVAWTAHAYYEPASGVAFELFTVPAPRISEPSRPYGTLRSQFRCNRDPWVGSGALRCTYLGASVNPPASAYPPGPIGDKSRAFVNDVLPRTSTTQPYSVLIAAYGSEHEQRDRDAWTALRAKYQSFLAAERKDGQLREGSSRFPEGSLREGHAPVIVKPLAAQRFLDRSPIPIRLAPPKGWTVAGYTLRIERKDPRGNWTPHVTIPVGAALAQSTGGYTGFGAGAPPGFLSVPGAWRLSAQVSSPNMSGWSEWVEFWVMTPPKPNALDPTASKRRP